MIFSGAMEINSLIQQFQLFSRANGAEENRQKLFEEIWVHYFPRLLVFIEQFIGKSPLDPEDLTQEVLFKVYSRIASYNPIYSFNTWLYRIARNHCLDAIKKLKSYRKLEERLSKQPSQQNIVRTVPEPEQHYLANETATGINRALQTLSSLDRQIAYFVFYEKMSYGQISQIINIPVGSIKSRVYHIRKKLHTSLEREGSI